MGFSERLREVRLSRGLSQGQLAEKIGQHRVSITNYEGGGREPGLDIVKGLAKALGTTAGYLLGDPAADLPDAVAEARAEYLTSTGDPDEDKIRRKVVKAFDRDIQKIRRDYLSDDFRILANIAKELAKRKKSGENI